MPTSRSPEEPPPGGDDLGSASGVLRRSAEMIRRLDDQLRRTRHLVSDRAVVDVRNPAPPTRLRLLIVDDNAVIRDVLGSLFRSECGDEVEIRTASGGAEALSTTTWQPDVIVLDWVMPGMDGLETARRLRGRGVTARIVVYSSAPPAEAEDAALAAGADRYLEKGADAEGLVRAVTEALQAQR